MIGSHHHEPDIQMKMLRHRFSLRNGVDINIDDLWIDGEIRHAGLLDGLSQGNSGQIGIAIAMTTKLQPTVQLGMMMQHDSRSIFIDHQSGRCQMTRHAISIEQTSVKTTHLEDLSLELLL